MASGPSARSAFIDEVADANTLREAWYKVQRAGRAPGIDGMTVDAFRAHAERRLTELGQSLRSGRYRPGALLRVNIPKASGGWRALGIPTITDRVAQSAGSMIVHERIASLYSHRSFAYRPFLGPRRAALFLKNAVNTAGWAVTADIEKFFDNVDHQVLSDQLRGAGFDPQGIRLILSWLLSPVHEKGQRYQPVKGLPQGSPIAPVLANLYLSGLAFAKATADIAEASAGACLG